MQSIISKDGLRHQLSFYGVPFALGSVMSHLDRTVFGAVTFPSCSSVQQSQSSSVRINPDNVLVLVVVSAFRIPRRRLRLCPRANKNLHIPAGYAESILLHNICLQGDMQIFICLQAMPKAFPQHQAPYFCNSILCNLQLY
ncbi:hypothetical protein T03_18002 [Trichinella britovi]|uniref:Uncharacterized protein n=1 Tax=Trichinella britovi TaxID=45882 RepID=A0A0V1D2G6_TRIBR|nr:hypothetical protein T03_18002 [Trichinella britovi]